MAVTPTPRRRNSSACLPVPAPISRTRAPAGKNGTTRSISAARSASRCSYENMCSRPTLGCAAIQIFVATGAEEAEGQRSGHAPDAREPKRLHHGFDLRRGDGLVGVAAHPIVHIVLECHPALALIGFHVGLKVAAGQEKSQAQERDVDCPRAPLCIRRSTSIPAFLEPPQGAHAGAMIEGEGKHSVRHHQPRCGSKRLAHGASVMEDAPGIDDVKRPERSEIIAVERRPLLNGPIGVAGEIKIPQAAGTEYRAYVVIEGMNARTEPA